MLNLTILNEAKFAAICSFDKNTNIEIADNIIQSFADASLTKIEDRMAILTNTLARIPSSKTNSLGRANFLATSFGKYLSRVRCENADEFAKNHPEIKAPRRLNRVQLSKNIFLFFTFDCF